MSKKFFNNYFQNQINLINFDNNTVNKLIKVKNFLKIIKKKIKKL